MDPTESRKDATENRKDATENRKDATERQYSEYADLAPVALRIGLGVVILAAGLHKLVEPGAWAVYMAPLFAARWPVGLDPTMVVFGVTEVPVGLALLADRWTAIAAGIVAVSMLGTVGNLAIAWVQTGDFADTLIRDFGLFVLATGVALRSLDGGGRDGSKARAE